MPSRVSYKKACTRYPLDQIIFWVQRKRSFFHCRAGQSGYIIDFVRFIIFLSHQNGNVWNISKNGKKSNANRPRSRLSFYIGVIETHADSKNGAEYRVFDHGGMGGGSPSPHVLPCPPPLKACPSMSLYKNSKTFPQFALFSYVLVIQVWAN